MRARRIGILFMCVGCSGSPSGSTDSGAGVDVQPAPIDVTLAQPCLGTTTLVITGQEDSSVPVRAYDTNGSLFCLRLDARQAIQDAGFSVSTDHETTAGSSFQLALFDAGTTMLAHGSDYTYGSAGNTTVVADLEYGVLKGDVVDVRLFVGTKTGSESTAVSMVLFQPLE